MFKELRAIDRGYGSSHRAINQRHLLLDCEGDRFSPLLARLDANHVLFAGVVALPGRWVVTGEENRRGGFDPAVAVMHSDKAVFHGATADEHMHRTVFNQDVGLPGGFPHPHG